MIPTLDKDYTTNFLFIFVAWINHIIGEQEKG